MTVKVLKVDVAKQTHRNSCWACCARLVNNFYHQSSAKAGFSEKTGSRATEQHDDSDKSNLLIGSDSKLAKLVGLKVNRVQNIQTVLEGLQLWDGTDDQGNLPSFECIQDSIQRNQPLVACVSDKKLDYDSNVSQGHYVLIIGATFADANNDAGVYDFVKVGNTVNTVDTVVKQKDFTDRSDKRIFIMDPVFGTVESQVYDPIHYTAHDKNYKDKVTRYWAMTHYTTGSAGVSKA